MNRSEAEVKGAISEAAAMKKALHKEIEEHAATKWKEARLHETLWDRYAMAALNVVVAHTPAQYATEAANVADAMMEERKKRLGK